MAAGVKFQRFFVALFLALFLLPSAQVAAQDPNAPGTMIPICHRDSWNDPTFEEIEIRADELEFHVVNHGDRYPVPRLGCEILNVSPTSTTAPEPTTPALSTSTTPTTTSTPTTTLASPVTPSVSTAPSTTTARPFPSPGEVGVRVAISG